MTKKLYFAAVNPKWYPIIFLAGKRPALAISSSRTLSPISIVKRTGMAWRSCQSKMFSLQLTSSKQSGDLLKSTNGMMDETKSAKISTNFDAAISVFKELVHLLHVCQIKISTSNIVEIKGTKKSETQASTLVKSGISRCEK